MTEPGPRISRRQALKAAGVVLGLPLLDAFLDGPLLRTLRAAGAPPPPPATPPVRLSFVFYPNGVIGRSFFPKTEGPLEALPPTLAGLERVKSEVLVLSGLALDNARAKGDGPGDHARAAAAFLTCAHPRKTAGADVKVGVSVDQAAAQVIGAATRFPSLELTAEAGSGAGDCDSGYSCAYVSNISWRGPSTPAPGLANPRTVFERLFGDARERRSAGERAARLRRERSILDYVAGDARRLSGELGRRDREKLDEYLTAVRAAERRIEIAEAEGTPRPPEGVEAPVGIPADPAEHLGLLYELAALALQIDATRVVSVMAGRGGSNRSYPQIGVREGHHHLSHHENDEGKIVAIERIDRLHVDLFGKFVARLAAIREGEGRLLDHAIVMFGSGIGDGNRHTHHDLPVLVAGGAATPARTTLRPGRHERRKTGTPLANLYLTMLHAVGAETSHFADSTAPLGSSL